MVGIPITKLKITKVNRAISAHERAVEIASCNASTKFENIVNSSLVFEKLWNSLNKNLLKNKEKVAKAYNTLILIFVKYIITYFSLYVNPQTLFSDILIIPQFSSYKIFQPTFWIF